MECRIFPHFPMREIERRQAEVSSSSAEKGQEQLDEFVSGETT